MLLADFISHNIICFLWLTAVIWKVFPLICHTLGLLIDWRELVTRIRQRTKRFIDVCVPLRHQQLTWAKDRNHYEAIKREIVRELGYLWVMLWLVVLATLLSNHHDPAHWSSHIMTISIIEAGFGLICASWLVWIYVWSGFLEVILKSPEYSYMMFNIFGRLPAFLLTGSVVLHLSNVVYWRYGRLTFSVLTWIIGPPLSLRAFRDVVGIWQAPRSSAYSTEANASLDGRLNGNLTPTRDIGSVV
ncbi:hypothetical protein BD410DRAFT_112028 [Rickenella mellea]|uniref:Uncharacterized protein n=1 Tax=Rickenella mellea TaxID=50990 RepID=A0A4Y7QBE8_9AGAM|nr:hypothetical protein BD410DRAFT_112028 [Rickenella mellea]